MLPATAYDTHSRRGQLRHRMGHPTNSLSLHVGGRKVRIEPVHPRHHEQLQWEHSFCEVRGTTTAGTREGGGSDGGVST